jgi:hypothetical protein
MGGVIILENQRGGRRDIKDVRARDCGLRGKRFWCNLFDVASAAQIRICVASPRCRFSSEFRPSQRA